MPEFDVAPGHALSWNREYSPWKVRSFVFNHLLGSPGLPHSYILLISKQISVTGPWHAPCCNPEAFARSRCDPLFSITCWVPAGFRAGYILLISKEISVNGGKPQGRSQVRSSLEIYNATCFQSLVRFGRQKIQNNPFFSVAYLCPGQEQDNPSSFARVASERRGLMSPCIA
jgi:hypothetical protein